MTDRFARMRHSIFLKLLLVAIAAGISINILVAVFFRVFMGSESNVMYQKNLHAYINYLVADIGIPPDLKKAAEIAESNSLHIRIEGRDGKWASSGAAPRLADLKHSRLQGDAHIGWRHGMIIIAVERKGISYVFATERGRFRQTGVEPIIVLLVFLSVVIVLSYLAIRRILKPVRLLSAGVEAVSRGDFDHRIPVGKKDELGELSESFNSMSVLIKDMLRSKEQLLLDASHELRSPLTRIKVAMEFLPEGKALESIAEDIGEIETMITELLESERLNAPHGGLAVREENIAVIVRETVRDFGARKPGIIIRDMPEVCTVNVDRARTGLVLKNILDNALKYSGEESAPVEISLIHGTTETVLEVADNGAGISPEDVPRVFEPFYRADRSRSRQTGGYGLGLSLCRKIMEAHGGSIGISSEPGKGTRVRLVFPARRRQ